MCLKEFCFMVVVACTLGSQLRQTMGLCLGFFSWDFFMQHCGHGHNVHMFSFHIVIPSHFPCLISHTAFVKCVTIFNLLKILLYVFLVGMIFIAFNCKFCYMIFVQLLLYYKWVGPRKNFSLEIALFCYSLK